MKYPYFLLLIAAFCNSRNQAFVTTPELSGIGICGKLLLRGKVALPLPRRGREIGNSARNVGMIKDGASSERNLEGCIPSKGLKMSRRHALLAPILAATQAGSQASAVGLADRLKQRSSEALSKPLLPSIVVQPVKELVFPDWLEGTWEARSQFVGYELPVKKLDKRTIMADKSIAGFQVGVLVLYTLKHGSVCNMTEVHTPTTRLYDTAVR